jgi:hypothetical protein
VNGLTLPTLCTTPDKVSPDTVIVIVATARHAPEGGICPIQFPSKAPANVVLATKGKMASANPARVRLQAFVMVGLSYCIAEISASTL